MTAVDIARVFGWNSITEELLAQDTAKQTTPQKLTSQEQSAPHGAHTLGFYTFLLNSFFLSLTVVLMFRESSIISVSVNHTHLVTFFLTVSTLKGLSEPLKREGSKRVKEIVKVYCKKGNILQAEDYGSSGG